MAKEVELGVLAEFIPSAAVAPILDYLHRHVIHLKIRRERKNQVWRLFASLARKASYHYGEWQFESVSFFGNITPRNSPFRNPYSVWA